MFPDRELNGHYELTKEMVVDRILELGIYKRAQFLGIMYLGGQRSGDLMKKVLIDEKEKFNEIGLAMAKDTSEAIVKILWNEIKNFNWMPEGTTEKSSGGGISSDMGEIMSREENKILIGAAVAEKLIDEDLIVKAMDELGMVVHK